MALAKFGGGVIQLAGSIGGNTYARNRYGNYVRARTKPTNPNSARQDNVRSAVAYLVDRWSSTLTAAQRTAWGLYADNVAMKNRLGETMHLSGFNHYVRSNTVLKMTGVPPIDAGPVIFELPAQDNILGVAGSEATQQLTASYDDTMAYATETGGRMFLFGGQPQNAQRNFFAGPWRYYGQVIGVDGAPPASPHVGTPGFAIAEAQRLWIYARISRADGRLSEPFRADCFIGA